MSSTTYLSSSDSGRPTFRRRASGFLLALAAEILIILALLWLSPTVTSTRKAPEKKPLSFSLSPSPKPAGKQVPRPRSSAKSEAAQHLAAVRPDATPVTAPEAKPSWLVAKDDFDSANIANIKSGDGNDSGKDSGSAYGPGEGPGGERLFNAEWYREPRDAELSPYMPHTGAPPGSWAEIACKTVPAYHVENCRPLGESPVGSGLARALRLASWQFLVRPPRVGGRTMVGAWVRIHFTFVERKSKRETPAPEDEGSQ